MILPQSTKITTPMNCAKSCNGTPSSQKNDAVCTSPHVTDKEANGCNCVWGTCSTIYCDHQVFEPLLIDPDCQSTTCPGKYANACKPGDKCTDAKCEICEILDNPDKRPLDLVVRCLVCYERLKKAGKYLCMCFDEDVCKYYCNYCNEKGCKSCPRLQNQVLYHGCPTSTAV